MKKRNVVLGLLLSFVCAISVFGLAGCGEASIKTIGENFEKLDATYAQYDNVFVEGNEHKVYFGPKVQQFIDDKNAEFVELEELYNVALAVSNQYIDQNRNYILYGIKESDLDGNARKKLDDFNKNLVAYNEEISKFVKFRDDFENHFKKLGDAVGDNFNQGILQDFKMAFGVLIEKNINLSTSFADAVEATRIYNALGEIALKPEDTAIVKDFICAKMLHIFTDLRISEISNKMMWSAVGKETESSKNDKDLIDNLLEKLDASFEIFKTQIADKSKENYRQLSNEEYAKVFGMTKEFLIEAEAFTQAVKDFGFVDFALKNGAILQKHKEKNEFAEVYLKKMDQFLSITLPNYMENVLKLIYA